jgi:formiminotetrahydrofolate cyclodeaminase
MKSPVPAPGNGTRGALQDIVSKALSKNVPRLRRNEFTSGKVRRGGVIEAVD